MSVIMKAKDFKNISEFIKEDVDILIGCDESGVDRIETNHSQDTTDIRKQILLACEEFEKVLIAHKMMLYDINTISYVIDEVIDEDIKLINKGFGCLNELKKDVKRTTIKTIDLINFFNEYTIRFTDCCLLGMYKSFSKIIYLSDIVNGDEC